MGLVLNNQQTNDAKILYLTDASTWGSDGLPAYTSITAATLKIYYRDPDNPNGTAVQTLDDAIMSIFTKALSASDLIFPIIINSGNIGVADSGIDQLPDGIWIIEYEVTWSGGTKKIEIELLLDAIIKADIYSKLATVNYQYLCSNNYYTKPIDDVLLLYCLRQGVLANAYVAQQSNIVDTIETIQLLLE